MAFIQYSNRLLQVCGNAFKHNKTGINTFYLNSLRRTFGDSSDMVNSKNRIENIYYEYIEDFNALSAQEKEYLIQEILKIHYTSIYGVKEETFRDLFSDKKSTKIKIILIREKKSNIYIGFSFYRIYEIFYEPNNTSNENKYVTTCYINAIMPSYRGYALGTDLVKSLEYQTQEEYPDCNRVSFNYTLNAFYYDLRTKWTPLVVPGINKLDSPHPENLLRKTINFLEIEPIEGNPFVTKIENVHVAGVDKEYFMKNIQNISPCRRFYMEQTQFKPGHLLCNLALYNLIEGNTLKLKPEKYHTFSPIAYEVIKYKTRFN
ncbi:hypothetical protein SteCoe_36505 [Stentor coeruleus]|uniref:Uncharacterized protein n=1 Tax=Stentor coeruleus TaxID=5963 RepID=A0A1R2APX2_9CILI|nr:hypothetical protein SteCoe_36505 [Stentor coeruleus]